MLELLLRICVCIWKTEDPDSEMVCLDAIVPISYGTNRDKLANGTRENLREALSLMKYRPYAVLAFANCGFLFQGADEIEMKLKEEMLREYNTSDYVLASETIHNTVEEARIIRRVLSLVPKRLLVITGEMHSRSARYVWQKMFPHAKIVICTIPHRYEYQSDHEVWWLQHGPWVWLLGNIIRHTMLRVLGLDTVERMHHGTKTFMPVIFKK